MNPASTALLAAARAERAGLRRPPTRAAGGPAARAPMAATGRCPSGAARGITLVELLVVVAVIATAAAAIVLTLPDPRGALVGEAEALAARLTAARDAAILNRRSVALRLDDGGYAFEQRAPAGWVALPGRAFAPRDWPAGVSAEVNPRGLTRIRFDATGLATPATVQLLREGVTVAVTVDAAGDVSVDAAR